MTRKNALSRYFRPVAHASPLFFGKTTTFCWSSLIGRLQEFSTYHPNPDYK
ncbi:hypothetical protein [Cyclobacterium plantarum]|uniref:Uncharacterized protein n=1 Tax=Cyclobacterium plantarum TaxID=2716263 RepID=A0ABX0HE02_9BACT|nr:hypothetical protein [Cyclobacterium plantarum]NHE58631.1 hypothetical protein [Cyclobacterium plantarum]